MQTSKLTKTRILFILGTDRFQRFRPNIKVPNSVFFKVKEGVKTTGSLMIRIIMVQTIGSLYQGYYGSNYCISMLRILWFKLLDLYVKDTMVQTIGSRQAELSLTLGLMYTTEQALREIEVNGYKLQYTVNCLLS